MIEQRTPPSTIPDFDFKLRWVNETLTSSFGDSLYLGRWRVGRVQQEIDSRGKVSDGFVPVCFLPGVKPRYEMFNDRDSAMDLLEGVVKFWLSGVND